jgi:phage tail sheath protein FI
MAAFTYPGVYIEEVSSGQHTISGVATSIAAFIGWSSQGPVGEATLVESWLEYQALYGGMVQGNYLGYAVYQFFANGGSQAYIIRLVDAAATTASSIIGGLQLYANSPGAWANGITVTISGVPSTLTGGTYTFNLTVQSSTGSVLERYTNISASPTSAFNALSIINNDSDYITFTAPSAASAPTFLPGYTIRGSITAKTFVAGETISQANGATAIVQASTAPLPIVSYTGTPTATDTWTGASSGATFVPTAVPAPSIQNAAATALTAGTSPTLGTDGATLIPNQPGFESALKGADGYSLLATVPMFNLLCVPGETNSAPVTELINFCRTQRAFMIVDADASLTHDILNTAEGPVDSTKAQYTPTDGSYGGFYFPWIQAPDPQAAMRPALFPPCGYVAGVMAWTDANRGVWKAPAGIQATLSGSLGLQFTLTDQQNGDLNQYGVNCLRQFPIYSNVVWGARTMNGSDAAGSQYKYVPIRRFASFIESSLYQGTQWVVFEPNAEPLWGQVRLSISTFLQDLFLKGAFAGTAPQQAYFVKCDGDNNPDSQVALGIVNITVGFAPLYPAEFVVIQIIQMSNS